MQERAKVSSMDIKAHINSLRRNPKFTEEMLKLVEKDLQYGLSIAETEEYTTRKYDYVQMTVYSDCLKKGYPEDVRACIAREGLTGDQMAVALEFYEKGVPIEIVSEVTKNTGQTAFAMRKLFLNITGKLQETADAAKAEGGQVIELLEQIKANLLSQLTEKDALLEKQQNELNEARRTIARFKSEPDEAGRSTSFVPVERREPKKKNHFVTAFFSRFVLKKKIDIVRLVAEKALDTKQLAQIRSAIEQGLREEQLLVLIKNQIPAEQMEEIINIAVYENKQED